MSEVRVVTERATEHFGVVMLVNDLGARFRIVPVFGTDGEGGSVLWGSAENYSEKLDWALPADVEGDVRYDGCANWDAADDTMVHECGAWLIVERAEALVHAMRMAAREIPGADLEGFGLPPVEARAETPVTGGE